MPRLRGVVEAKWQGTQCQDPKLAHKSHTNARQAQTLVVLPECEPYGVQHLQIV